jgi:hypothetical protein
MPSRALGALDLEGPLRGRSQRKRWFVSVSLHTPPATRVLRTEAVAITAARDRLWRGTP